MIVCIKLEGISLPIGLDWKSSGDSGCLAGIEGLLDPQVVNASAPLDQDRALAIENALSARGGSVELGRCGDRPFLFCSYSHSGNIVNSYVVELPGGRELNAVYVIKPEYAQLAEIIKDVFVRELQEGGDDSTDLRIP